MLPELNGQEARERIAKRLAAELQDGEVVNLGIGIPQLIPNFVSDDVRIILQTENGAILACQARDPHDLRVIDAGGKAISVLPGGSFIASDLSFALMRGGHVDVDTSPRPRRPRPPSRHHRRPSIGQRSRC